MQKGTRLDWDHLRVFLAVARHGQLLAAGRKLGLNHTTVARRREALEAELGLAVIEKTPTGSTLTLAGQQLVPVAERMEAAMLQIPSLLSPEGDISGTVRIGAPDGLGSTFLTRELGSLAAKHPALTIELVPLPRTFSLSRREADIAITLDRPAQGRLIMSKLTDYSLGVYASQDYLAEKGVPLVGDDLRNHMIVTGVEDFSYAAALSYTAVLQLKSPWLYRCASVVGQMEAIRSGAGIGILHDFAVRPEDRLTRILPEMNFLRSYWMITHPDTHQAPAVALCRAHMAARFRQARATFVQYQDGNGDG